MSGKGKSLTISEKELIVKIKHYFDSAKKRHSRKDKHYSKSATELTSIATKLSEISVKRVMAEFNTKKELSKPAAKGSSPYTVHESVKTICQDIIRSHNISRNHLSLRLLKGVLNDKYKIEIARETLRRCLYRWNIIHGSVIRHTALRERDYVVNARREYLIKKRTLDKTDRTLIYLDETFINKNYSGSDASWYCDDWKENPLLNKSFGPYINKPSGKGDRFIILNAITKQGWVDGAKLVFKAKTNTGDYHGSMDENNFTKWFTTQLLPNIPDNSVIIMDNASYHNTYKDDGVPSLTRTKKIIQKWLSNNNIAFTDDLLRTQLIDLINKHRPEKIYTLDDMLENDPMYRGRNIEILRTPQYHPELQPIEKCWAVLKQYMAQHCDFTLKGLRNNLEIAWTKLTPKTMKGIMKKMIYWQNYHFEQDNLLDTIDDKECM